MTTRIGAPQVGQRAARGCGGLSGGGWPSLGGPGAIRQADGRERDGTAGMEKAEVADFHEAIGQDMLEEPAEKLHDVEVGSAWTCTAHFPVGEGDGAVLEADERLLEMATLKTYGARYVKAEWPW